MLIKYSENQLVEKLKFVLDEPFTDLNSALERLELNVEESLSDTLDGLGITNSKKTDRKSLPVHQTVERKRIFPSYFNRVLDVKVLKQMVLRSLLNSGQGKIRFYAEVTPIYQGDKIAFLNYSINWYEHEYN